MSLTLLVIRRAALTAVTAAVAAALGNRAMHRLWRQERAARPLGVDNDEDDVADGDAPPLPAEPQTR